MMDLPNNLFSREGIPIVPFNAKGDVADKNWRLLTEKTQTTKDLQLIQEKHPGPARFLELKTSAWLNSQIPSFILYSYRGPLS